MNPEENIWQVYSESHSNPVMAKVLGDIDRVIEKYKSRALASASAEWPPTEENIPKIAKGLGKQLSIVHKFDLADQAELSDRIEANLRDRQRKRQHTSNTIKSFKHVEPPHPSALNDQVIMSLKAQGKDVQLTEQAHIILMDGVKVDISEMLQEETISNNLCQLHKIVLQLAPTVPDIGQELSEEKFINMSIRHALDNVEMVARVLGVGDMASGVEEVRNGLLDLFELYKTKGVRYVANQCDV